MSNKGELATEKKLMRSMSSFRITKSIPFNEFNNLKKVLADDKFSLDNITSKERKINELSRNMKTRDHKIIKSKILKIFKFLIF